MQVVKRSTNCRPQNLSRALNTEDKLAHDLKCLYLTKKKNVELGLSCHPTAEAPAGLVCSVCSLLTSVNHWHWHVLDHRCVQFWECAVCAVIGYICIVFLMFYWFSSHSRKWTSWKQTQAWVFSGKVECIRHPRQEDFLEQMRLMSPRSIRSSAGGLALQSQRTWAQVQSSHCRANAFHVGNATLSCEMRMNFTLSIVYFLFTFDYREI